MSGCQLIECDGFSLAKARVPPFSVRTGEIINIMVPEHWDETELLKVLTGTLRHPALSLRSTVALANELTLFPGHRLSFLGRWRLRSRYRKPLTTYLQKRGLNEVEIGEAERKTKMDLSLPLKYLSGNGRLRLSVWFALRDAALIIFADTAVDREGQLGVFKDVVEALPCHGAIHLCYPQYHGFSSTLIPRAERIPPQIQFANEITIRLDSETAG